MNDDFKQNYQEQKPDIEIILDDGADTSMGQNTNYAPHKHFKKIKNREPLTKKEKWIVGIEITLIILGITAIIFLLLHPTKDKAKKVAVVKVAKTAPAIVYKSQLTGMPVTAAQAAMPVTGVMIENSDGARPQSGLSEAGVIFEAIAEGGVTRFLALFQEGNPTSLGPVRSARPYYVDWLSQFDAAYAHTGGSPDGLAAISNNNVKNLDEFINAGAYTRIATRAAPHNLYTSMPALINLEKSKGYTKSTFTSFMRKADKPLVIPTATKININIAGADYAIHYDYDKLTNSYNRSEAGVPMVDNNTGKQLHPKVVIAIVVPITNGALDASGAYYSEYSDIGSGKAYIFQDGGVEEGTWSKSSPTSQLLFGDANSSPQAINAGQTWVTAVGTASLVTYSN